MSNIESLTHRVGELNDAVDHWNSAMVVALVLAAVAAIAVVVTTRLALVRAKELGETQALLLKAKDDDLALNLKEKDLKIVQASQKAAEAAERAEAEKIARLRLQHQLMARRLTGQQKDSLAGLLSSRTDAVAIVSTMLDGEGSDLADDFDSAFRKAGWKTLRITNHISAGHGIRVGTVAGTVLQGMTQLVQALDKIGVAYELATFKDGEASTSPPFQPRVIYLVIERKPEPNTADAP